MYYFKDAGKSKQYPSCCQGMAAQTANTSQSLNKDLSTADAAAAMPQNLECVKDASKACPGCLVHLNLWHSNNNCERKYGSSTDRCSSRTDSR
jgi:hypothetical protein